MPGIIEWGISMNKTVFQKLAPNTSNCDNSFYRQSTLLSLQYRISNHRENPHEFSYRT